VELHETLRAMNCDGLDSFEKQILLNVYTRESVSKFPEAKCFHTVDFIFVVAEDDHRWWGLLEAF
jgi:hypothetical protein